MLTRPVLGGMIPAMLRKVVVLPAPFGPTRPSTSPGRTVKLRSRTAANSPYIFVKPATSITRRPRCTRLRHDETRILRSKVPGRHSATPFGFGHARGPTLARVPVGTEAWPHGGGAMSDDKCNVLVVDDHRDGADAAVMLLGSWGHEAMAAYSAKDALSKARESEPDVALLDLGLPDKD